MRNKPFGAFTRIRRLGCPNVGAALNFEGTRSRTLEVFKPLKHLTGLNFVAARLDVWGV